MTKTMTAALCFVAALGSLAGCAPYVPTQADLDHARYLMDNTHVSHDSFTFDDGTTVYSQSICDPDGCSTTPY